MNRLLVEIDDFVDAAHILDERVGDTVATALARLSSALDNSGAMAGDDPGGRAWADSYDPAAQSVVGATRQTASAAYATSAMFGRSAVNYARAEAASTTGGTGTDASAVSARLPTRSVPFAVPPPPSAVGGSAGGEPSGWGLIKDVVGYVWPNGHQDRLRRAADAYRRCAASIDDVAFEPILAVAGFARDRLPEADDIATVCGGLRTRLGELASAHRTLGRACAEFADRLDECHSEVVSELRDLGIESGVIQGVGIAASIFTFGGAEVPAQGVQIARIAAVAARVGELIRTFTTAVRVACEAVPTAAEVAQRITRTLEGLNSSRLAIAGVTDVPRAIRATSMANHGREAVATGRLARAGRSALRTPKRLIGRKPGEPGLWGNRRTLARHFKDHGAEVGARTEDEYVSKASDLLDRGVRGELPVKVDTDGTIRVFDPVSGRFGSFRPDGGTRTFYRPSSPTYFDRQPGVLQ